MQTNDRIEKLKKKLSDKSLKRSERKELLDELKRERYKLDPRKPISVRKQKILDAIYNFIIGVEFSYMGVAEYLKLNRTHHELNGILFGSWMAVFLIYTVIYSFFAKRYKKEPEDELSIHNTAIANSIGYVITSMIVLFAAFGYFTILGHEVLPVRREYVIFFIAGFTFLTRLLNTVIFLILEGREDPGEEE